MRVSQAPYGIDMDDGLGEIRHAMEKNMMGNFTDLVRLGDPDDPYTLSRTWAGAGARPTAPGPP
jgi:hypothetical protein